MGVEVGLLHKELGSLVAEEEMGNAEPRLDTDVGSLDRSGAAGHRCIG